jgi:hypothetical protein
MCCTPCLSYDPCLQALQAMGPVLHQHMGPGALSSNSTPAVRQPQQQQQQPAYGGKGTEAATDGKQVCFLYCNQACKGFHRLKTLAMGYVLQPSPIAACAGGSQPPIVSAVHCLCLAQQQHGTSVRCGLDTVTCVDVSLLCRLGWTSTWPSWG